MYSKAYVEGWVVCREAIIEQGGEEPGLAGTALGSKPSSAPPAVPVGMSLLLAKPQFHHL